jgi:hypothetical protein
LGTRYLNEKKFSPAVETRLRKAAVYYAPKKLDDFPDKRKQYEALVEKASEARRAAESAERRQMPDEAFKARATVFECEEKQQDILDALKGRMAGDPEKLKHIRRMYNTLIRDDGHHPLSVGVYNAMTMAKARSDGPTYTMADISAICARAPAGMNPADAITWWQEVGRRAAEADERAAADAEWRAAEAEHKASVEEDAALTRHAQALLRATPGYVPTAWRVRAAARADEMRVAQARQQADAQAERDRETDAAIARQNKGEKIPAWIVRRCDVRRAELAAARASKADTEFPVLCQVPVSLKMRSPVEVRYAAVAAAPIPPPRPVSVPEPAVPGKIRVRVITEAEFDEHIGTKAESGPDLSWLVAGAIRATRAANEERIRCEAYFNRPARHYHMDRDEWEDWEEEVAYAEQEDADAEWEKDFMRQLRHMPEEARHFIMSHPSEEWDWALQEWEHREYTRGAGLDELHDDEDDDAPEVLEAVTTAAKTVHDTGKSHRAAVSPSEKLGEGPVRDGRKGSNKDHGEW